MHLTVETRDIFAGLPATLAITGLAVTRLAVTSLAVAGLAFTGAVPVGTTTAPAIAARAVASATACALALALTLTLALAIRSAGAGTGTAVFAAPVAVPPRVAAAFRCRTHIPVGAWITAATLDGAAFRPWRTWLVRVEFATGWPVATPTPRSGTIAPGASVATLLAAISAAVAAAITASVRATAGG